MILPAEDNLTIYRGATFYKRWQWKTGNPATAVDMTDATVEMHIRPSVESKRIYLIASTTNGRITLDDAAAGEFSMTLTAAETELLEFESGVYDLIITMTDSTVWPLVRGVVDLQQRVTR